MGKWKLKVAFALSPLKISVCKTGLKKKKSRCAEKACRLEFCIFYSLSRHFFPGRLPLAGYVIEIMFPLRCISVVVEISVQFGAISKIKQRENMFVICTNQPYNYRVEIWPRFLC